MIINMNGAKAPETPSPILQEKTVTPETLPVVIGADEGYTGLSQVTVNPDAQLIPTNIRSGKTIFGVDGTFEGTVTQGDKFTKLIDRSITTLTAEDFENVTSIGEYAFAGCDNLTSVDLPNTVSVIASNGFFRCRKAVFNGIGSNITEIGSHGFGECYSITSLNLPNATTIQSFAFSYCINLTSITLAEGLTKILSGTFYECRSLSSLAIPSTVTEIEYSCFYNCPKLISIVMKSSTPPLIYDSSFQGINENVVFTVPKGSLTTYQTADVWSNYADKMVEAVE